MQNTQKNFYKKLLGGIGERKAERYLKKNKYKILAKNYTTHFGEIDIIAKSKEEEIIFIEVKTRKDDYFGRPSEAVNKIKQEKYVLVAKEYLLKTKNQEAKCRFDVIEVENGKINHIIDAFWC